MISTIVRSLKRKNIFKKFKPLIEESTPACIFSAPCSTKIKATKVTKAAVRTGGNHPRNLKPETIDFLKPLNLRDCSRLFTDTPGKVYPPRFQ